MLVKKLVLRIASLNVTRLSRIWASCLLRTFFLMCARSWSELRTSADCRRAYERVGLRELRDEYELDEQEIAF